MEEYRPEAKILSLQKSNQNTIGGFGINHCIKTQQQSSLERSSPE